MRPGEYLALRWRDIDLERMTARVVRAVSFPDHGPPVFKGPKTKALKRTIDISPQIRDALRIHRTRQDRHLVGLQKIVRAPLLLEHMRRTGTNYERRKSQRAHAKAYIDLLLKNDLVFPSRTGATVSPHNLATRTMSAACTAAGIKRRPPYSLRHSMATIALANGADIKAVSEKLGHATIALTLSTYIHVVPMMRSSLGGVLADALY